jgi:hypothetical protein
MLNNYLIYVQNILNVSYVYAPIVMHMELLQRCFICPIHTNPLAELSARSVKHENSSLPLSQLRLSN